MRVITDGIIEETIAKAQTSPRKRAHYILHEPEDPVQRMVNAVIPGSYIPPHKHENPDKIELFAILKGQVAALKFTSDGKIDKIHLLDENGPIKIVDVRPRIYHGFIALKPSALLEIIQGPYNPDTHKHWPDWSPREDDPKAAEFLHDLEDQVKAYLEAHHGQLSDHHP